MDEKETPKEDKKKESVVTKDAGLQSETTSELDRADAIAERQKKENDRREEILRREEALEARRMLGGRAEAGQTQEKKEETPQEYKDRILRGEL